MSNAIVAKAINSTIGTPEFKGLDEIFNEHLDKLDEVLKENIEGIKEAVLPVSNLSNPIYNFRQGDGIIASVNSNNNYEKTIEFGYDGVLAMKIRRGVPDSSDKGYVLEMSDVTEIGDYQLAYIEESGVDNTSLTAIKVKEGSQISIVEKPDAPTNSLYVYIYGHTEFAPSLNINMS